MQSCHIMPAWSEKVAKSIFYKCETLRAPTLSSEPLTIPNCPAGQGMKCSKSINLGNQTQ